jgi:hypothetical protein
MTAMSDPIQLISALLNEISSQADIEESAEWYLRSYLVDYKRTLLRKWSSQEIEFATGALMRFCAEALDTHGSLYRQCAEIAEEGTRMATQLRESGR